VFGIKGNCKLDMGTECRKYFAVDITNSIPAHELIFKDRKLVGSYLHVGLWKNGTWRNFKMRQDFIAADKVQMEDDITASVVVPLDQIPGSVGGFSVESHTTGAPAKKYIRRRLDLRFSRTLFVCPCH
jgi:hypothetical protein